MSYDLIVRLPLLPDDLDQRWSAAMARAGVAGDVQLGDHAYGFLPWRLADGRTAGCEVAIRAFDVDAYLNELTQNEGLLEFEPEVLDRLRRARHEAVFSARSANGEISFAWLAAATLAQVTDGVLDDPQRGTSYTGPAAVAEAQRQQALLSPRLET